MKGWLYLLNFVENSFPGLEKDLYEQGLFDNIKKRKHCWLRKASLIVEH
ncbi:hypothetical protein SAMN02745151_02783 [[Clostridium] propionicum DSM 1682]|uniref:Uncharacterized protein n=1 Tax=Anaerotignum propionicum DSM 1682 TaxID=991789 RepID=A0A0X8V8Q6_ANAPI|nr:hypothetical protein CPRO_05880 [Anaerotignum propionicum DSM 1682]SHF10146.1 hypothetical protein SAMN02745151_02783 [[Clostridium] propionicum DSM 1682] [Anaerotignum propionicum DSM 1682]